MRSHSGDNWGRISALLAMNRAVVVLFCALPVYSDFSPLNPGILVLFTRILPTSEMSPAMQERHNCHTLPKTRAALRTGSGTGWGVADHRSNHRPHKRCTMRVDASRGSHTG